MPPTVFSEKFNPCRGGAGTQRQTAVRNTHERGAGRCRQARATCGKASRGCSHPQGKRLLELHHVQGACRGDTPTSNQWQEQQNTSSLGHAVQTGCMPAAAPSSTLTTAVGVYPAEPLQRRRQHNWRFNRWQQGDRWPLRRGSGRQGSEVAGGSSGAQWARGGAQWAAARRHPVLSICSGQAWPRGGLFSPSLPTRRDLRPNSSAPHTRLPYLLPVRHDAARSMPRPAAQCRHFWTGGLGAPNAVAGAGRGVPVLAVQGNAADVANQGLASSTAG